MKRPDRRMTEKLPISRETVRALTRIELAGVAGADTGDPCVVAKPFAIPSKDAACG
jgi:hypothetical protein